MIKKTYLKTKNICKVQFSCATDNAASVSLLGLNNDWETPIPLTKKKGGLFTVEVPLPKNTQHEFKYLVNETEWWNDVEADGEAPNDFGGTNSVIIL